MYSRRQLDAMRHKLEMDTSIDIDMDDVEIISRWTHNTNIEASNELLKRLKRHHKEMDL